ncbi:MAG: hypothetical protein CL910_03085 [Deltaproteobacteria bacterium]|nr:hypothetical protein [Deltaproteobacteria bacterium]
MAVAASSAHAGLGGQPVGTGKAREATHVKPPVAIQKGAAPERATTTPRALAQPSGWLCVVPGRIEAGIHHDLVGKGKTQSEAMEKAFAACKAVGASCAPAECTPLFGTRLR